MKPLARGRVLLASVWFSILTTQGSAAQETRSWVVDANAEPAVALDCDECGDDIGLFIACNEDGGGALASVFWLAFEPHLKELGRAPLAELLVEVGGYRATYPADMTEMGMLGFVPQFELSATDPTVAAFQAGETARFELADQSVSISLRGAGQALAGLALKCRLAITPNPVLPDPNQIETPTAP